MVHIPRIHSKPRTSHHRRKNTTRLQQKIQRQKPHLRQRQNMARHNLRHTSRNNSIICTNSDPDQLRPLRTQPNRNDTNTRLSSGIRRNNRRHSKKLLQAPHQHQTRKQTTPPRPARLPHRRIHLRIIRNKNTTGNNNHTPHTHPHSPPPRKHTGIQAKTKKSPMVM